MENDITMQEFKTAFVKWNEQTTTSTSGQHLGHYKWLLSSDHCDN
jgi:hypothetical protein